MSTISPTQLAAHTSLRGMAFQREWWEQSKVFSPSPLTHSLHCLPTGALHYPILLNCWWGVRYEAGFRTTPALSYQNGHIYVSNFQRKDHKLKDQQKTDYDHHHWTRLQETFEPEEAVWVHTQNHWSGTHHWASKHSKIVHIRNTLWTGLKELSTPYSTAHRRFHWEFTTART